MDAYDLSNSFMLLSCMIDELLFHDGVVLEVCRFITSLVETVRFGSQTCHTVCLAEHNFRLNALDVAGVPCTFMSANLPGICF